MRSDSCLLWLTNGMRLVCKSTCGWICEWKEIVLEIFTLNCCEWKLLVQKSLICFWRVQLCFLCLVVIEIFWAVDLIRISNCILTQLGTSSQAVMKNGFCFLQEILKSSFSLVIYCTTTMIETTCISPLNRDLCEYEDLRIDSIRIWKYSIVTTIGPWHIFEQFSLLFLFFSVF